jgi:pyridoxamine 5'-phosphate oxidase
MSHNPFDVFKEWFDEALAADVLEPNGFCLSTVVDNRPSARIVLMKGFDERGFSFYTNYESRKSKEMSTNPYAAGTFWWGPLERSVRIEGEVEKVSDEESEAYYGIRPRSAQIGAWSSQQSRPISDRDTLEKQEAASISRFDNVEKIDRPKHWGGWRIKANRIEFWKGREARLHDRIVYTRNEVGDWDLQRVQP